MLAKVELRARQTLVQGAHYRQQHFTGNGGVEVCKVSECEAGIFLKNELHECVDLLLVLKPLDLVKGLCLKVSTFSQRRVAKVFRAAERDVAEQDSNIFRVDLAVAVKVVPKEVTQKLLAC